MLLDAGGQAGAEANGASLENMASSLLASSRETDIVGWYKERTTVGVMFTGLVVNDKRSVLSTILSRVKFMLRDDLIFKQFSQVSISFHFFPDDWDHANIGRPSNPALYPDLTSPGNAQTLVAGRQANDRHCGKRIGIASLLPGFSGYRGGHQTHFERPCAFQTATGRTVRTVLHLSEIPLDVCQ
jgi:hypothetical protein